MKNGDKITLKIEKLENGLLIVSTNYSKEINQDASKVINVSKENPVEIYLGNGWKIRGRIWPNKNGLVIIKGPQGKFTIKIDRRKVKSISTRIKAKKKWDGS